jgi:hypothetical protein
MVPVHVPVRRRWLSSMRTSFGRAPAVAVLVLECGEDRMLVYRDSLTVVEANKNGRQHPLYGLKPTTRLRAR